MKSAVRFSKTMSPRIAIIGAGPGGLVLARLLSIAGIGYVIYDLRPKPTDASSEPSGSLDLHVESGQYALKKCGLLHDFIDMVRPGSEDICITDQEGNVVYSDNDTASRERPEVDRAQLTKLLRDSVPAEHIEYEQKVTEVRQLRDGLYIVFFDSQPSETFEMVIGADGAWSRVRPLVTSVRPYYAGVSVLTLHITAISGEFPEISEMIGKGNFWALSPTKGIMAQRSNVTGTDSARIYLLISAETEYFLEDCGIDFTNFKEAIGAINSDPRFLGDWGDKLKALIQSSDESQGIWAKPLYMLPVDHKWIHRKGVTLLGDAAHLMTPFSGEGVNAAMLDAVDLADSLISAFKKSTDFSYSEGIMDAFYDQLVEGYEETMFARAESNARETARNLDIFFKRNAPESVVDLMNSYGTLPE